MSFFIFSSGDKDTQWIDEYKISGGELDFSRNEMETESFWGSIIYYLQEAIKLNTFEFKRFAAFQLYDLLFDNTYCCIEKADGRQNGHYTSEETTDGVQEHVETMSIQEQKEINRSLKVLFNLKLDNSLKESSISRSHLTCLITNVGIT